MFSITKRTAVFLAFFLAWHVVAAPLGQNKIILPLELVAGEPATLAVLTPDGHIAPGTRVVLSMGQVLTTDQSGRAHFLAPLQTDVLFARIIGSEAREAADVLPKKASHDNLQLMRVPTIVSVSDRLVITGSGFDGDADKNSVEIGSERSLVLAASPVELIVIPPPNAPLGPAKLMVAARNAEATENVTFINIAPISSTGIQVRSGKKMTIRLLVRGTASPVQLGIENLAPNVARFDHGNELLTGTTGGEENSAAIHIKGTAAGQFSFSVRLESDCGPRERAVTNDFLRAAMRFAGPKQRVEIASIVKELQQKGARSTRLLQKLRNIANRGGPPDFQALIRAAERSLGGV